MPGFVLKFGGVQVLHFILVFGGFGIFSGSRGRNSRFYDLVHLDARIFSDF